MRDSRILSIGLVCIGLVLGVALGGYAAILPTKPPYTTQVDRADYTCTFVNSSLTQCSGTGTTELFKVCVSSYWWGQICRTYRTVTTS